MLKTAVIFSWDCLVPAFAEIAGKSWEATAEANHFAFPRNPLKRSFSYGNAYTITHIFGWTDDAARVAEISEERNCMFRRLVEEQGIDAPAGVRAMLLALREAKIPCAVICRDERENIDFVARVLTIDSLFTAIISPQDDSASALSEDDFMHTADALDCAPSEIIVVENSVKNVETAVKLGFKTIAVAAPEMHALFGRAGAGIVFSKLGELDLSTLKALRSL
ncbi:MAG: HAD family phosphatase [Opitutae bacterium]|nr:HAD family phosphatase [Opitutae bacterium]